LPCWETTTKIEVRQTFPAQANVWICNHQGTIRLDASTSASLLLRIRNPEDNGAWQDFARVYSTLIREYCLHRKLQTSDADDIVQDVLLAVSSAIRTFEYDPAKGRFRSWLGTIVANRIRNLQIKQAHRYAHSIDFGHSSESVDNPLPFSAAITDPDSAWVEIYSQRIFAAACERVQPDLAPEHWACFEATWVRQESAAAVARAMKMPIQQVYLHKSRILKRLEAEVRILADEIPFPRSRDSIH
jgi:RNA polymerase sigma factor (sigma-70 family)